MRAALTRRELFGALGAAGIGLLNGRARADPGSFDVIELTIERDPKLAKRCKVVVPKRATERPWPVVVLLHGLGETKSEQLGIDAWLAPYGMARALERTREPELRREKENHLSEAELAELNRSLRERPFEGMVLVCPYMRNPHSFAGGSGTMFARYAQWLREGLLPAVYERVPRASRAREQTGIAGVSLGGYAALELYLRSREVFATVGTVQGAFRVASADRYAEQIAGEAGAARPAVYVATSSNDPYRAANERFARELKKRGIPTRLSVRRGPHSQGWLREIGTLELLLWHDRVLRGAPWTGEVRPERP